MSLPKAKFTLEEYLALDQVSEERLEYWNGDIFSMSGASPQHVQIQVNLAAFLHSGFQNLPCRVFSSDMRIKVPAYPPYRCPDLSALCGEPLFENIHGLEALTDPTLIVEILSPTTEVFDKSEKFEYYKSIPSFIEYLVVSQDQSHVTRHWQTNETWYVETVNSLDKEIKLLSVNVNIPMQVIYREVTLQA
jgi:Uma2 family endonuclease